MKNSASPSLDNGYGRTRTCGPKGEEVTSLFFLVWHDTISKHRKNATHERSIHLTRLQAIYWCRCIQKGEIESITLKTCLIRQQGRYPFVSSSPTFLGVPPFFSECHPSTSYMSYRIELSICLSVTYRPIYLPLSFVSIQSGSTRSTVDCAFYTIHTRLPVSVYVCALVGLYL